MDLRAMLKLMRMVIHCSWENLYYSAHLRAKRLDLRCVRQETLGLPEDYWYSDSGGPDLERVLRQLKISQTDIALDVGCGKGGAMITLARYPFQRVEGVDSSRELVAIAEQNFRRLRLKKCRVYTADAARFDCLDDYNFIYMYNPFPYPVMKDFIANLEKSLSQSPRFIRLLYKNPVCDAVIQANGIFKLTSIFDHSTHPFFLYLSLNTNHFGKNK
jgi:SAM-dependent methyltransferase